MTSSPPPEAPLLALRGVGKTFPDGTRALRGVDVALRDGEVVALLGQSGCGKSTVLRLVAGLAAPTEGRIDWRARPARGEVGLVFQDPTLMPWARVAANVALPLRLLGLPRAEARARVAAALDLVGLGAAAAAFPRQLSGGMRMRVAIARALVTRPRLLLMDEPFAALDEITRQRLNDETLALQARVGCTILFVTHSVYEAVYLADRVLVMTPRPGRIAAELAVPAPAEGRTEAWRTSPGYGATCARVSAALRAAMAA